MRKKTDALKQLMKFIENHFRGILIASLIVVIVVPLVVWLVHRIFQRNDTCGFFGVSADGFLAYIGAIFSGLMSLLVAIVALIQGEASGRSRKKSSV